MDSLASRARRSISNGDFEEAEVLLTKAIKVSMASPNLSLYDLRASVYERLDKLDRGLVDSKFMLQLDDKDARGYLRAGKICQLLNKDRTALKYYARGCERVPLTAPLFKMIKKLHQTVQCRLLENIVRCDPFVLLPVELLREITSYLDFRQKIRCLSVCKRWQAVLISDKRFYGRLNLLAPDLKRIKASSIESYVKKAQGRLEWLMTERMLAPAVLKHHLKFANELAVLHIPCQRVLLSELPRARNLRRLTLTGTEKGQLPSIDEILNIGRAFALLTHLKARTVRVPGYSMPILKLINTELSCLKSLEISLDSWIQTDELFMYDGKATMQNLQELKLYDGDQRYTAGLLLGPTLELPNTLKILSAKILPDPSNEALQLPDRLVGLDLTVDGQMPLGLKIPAVRRLLLRRYIGGITMDDWARLFSHLCELQLTEAQECGQFALILGTCQNLETLVLHPRFAVTGSYESELGTLAIRNPQLRHLNLSLFLELRGATLARLVHGLVHLKELVIDGCGQIDRDVLTWVRSRGVLVRQSLAD